MKTFLALCFYCFGIFAIIILQEFVLHYEKYLDLSIIAIGCFLICIVLTGDKLTNERNI